MKTKLFAMGLLLGVGLAGAGTWTTFNAQNSELPSDTVYSIAASDHVVWFGTASGLAGFDGSIWTRIPFSVDDPGQTESANRIKDITVEQPGNMTLWLATDAGAWRFNTAAASPIGGIRYHVSNSGLVSNRVATVVSDFSVVQWFGTDVGLSLMFSNGKWTTCTTANYLSYNNVLSIGVDQTTGWKYIGTRGGGVSRVRVDSVDGITSASSYDYTWASLPSDTILSIYVDEKGFQWIGTDQGLAYHEDTETKLNWSFFFTENGLPDNRIQAITKDKSGCVWLGTHDGVSRWNGESFTNYTTHDGLADDDVLDVASDDDGSVWAATKRGVSRWKESNGVETASNRTVSFRLNPNFPNPFNSSTVLTFDLATDAKVVLDVWNVSGERIATLVNGFLPGGRHSSVWNGTNSARPAGSGIYLAVLTIDNRVNVSRDVRKMMLIE